MFVIYRKSSLFLLSVSFLSLLISCQKPHTTDNEKVLQTNKENVTQLPAERHTDDQTTQQPIRIINPADGNHVCMETLVRGSVSDPNLQVFVLIHPMSTGSFWVQQLPERGTNWHILGRFGEPNVGIGNHFEIIAIASSNRTLFNEGQTLPSPLPDNSEILIKSEPVIVTRNPCLH